MDRGKPGSKMHVLSDANGLPLLVGLSAANTHDSLAPKPMIVGHQTRHDPYRGRYFKPQRLHADKAYDVPHLRKWLWGKRIAVPKSDEQSVRNAFLVTKYLRRDRVAFNLGQAIGVIYDLLTLNVIARLGESVLMDPLTQLVELLRPRALLWKHMVGNGDFAWRFPAEGGVIFGRVMSSYCRFELSEGEWGMGPGDHLLLAAPPDWILRGGDGDARVVDFENVSADVALPESGCSTDNQDRVHIVGGNFEFNSVNTEILAPFLSPIVHMRSSRSTANGRMVDVFAMIDAEASATRPGREAVLSRLLEIVLIELLRAPEMLSGQHRGMIIGLTDPQVASVLRSFHVDIRKNWSVASMAAEAGMSRSVFSQRFSALVGQPPMAYVLYWRMAVARDSLRFGGQSVDETAIATGYASASAFSTAFTRTVGRSPARYAREGGTARH